MAQQIGPSGDKQRAAKIPRPAESVAAKAAKGAPVPPAHISRTSGIPEKSEPIDRTNPSLPRPKILIPSDEEARTIEDNLKRKLTDPIPVDTIASRVAQPSQELKKRREAAAEEIPKLIKSKDSFAAMMQVQKLLMEASNLSIDISGAIMDVLSQKQLKEQEKSSKLMREQMQAQQKLINAGIASKILAWIGDAVNIISAAVAVAGAVFSTVMTGGALTPVLVASVLWLNGALITTAGHILDEMGTLKDAKLEWLGIVFTAVGTVLSLGGYAMTGGLSATIQAGDATLQAVVRGVTIFEKTMPILQGIAAPTAQITSAVYKFQVEGIHADKVTIEKEQNQIESMINQTAKGISNMLATLNEHLLKGISADIRERGRTLDAITRHMI